MSYATSANIVIHAPRGKVWDAITKPDLVKAYFFDTNMITDWKVGSSLMFRGEWEGKSYEDRGTVLSFEPMKGLSYDYWSSFSGREDTPELRQVIRYDLEDVSENGVQGVRVTVHQSNMDTRERADHSAQNWRGVLEGMKKFVEQSTAGKD